ncbi:MAG: putative portal protein [Prokaryotic dsDNA virus sp.]|nr:MAG: putative portal protein [Prokaryotic dsDNA virus sp.]
MSDLTISDGPFARLLKAVGLVSVRPDGQVEHNAGADYVPDHGFRSQYDPKSALSVLAAFPFPYACVTAISTDLSQVPLKVYRGRGKNAEMLDNHPVLDLLSQPSSRISGIQFRRQVYTDSTLVGNCYILIAGNNEPMSLLRLHPSRVTVSPLQDGQPDKYMYDGGAMPAEYDYEQVLHVRSPSWSDDPTSLWGVGAVQPLHHDLTTEKAQSELAARTASTGQPTGILSPRAEGDLWNKRQIETLRQAYESQMRAGGSGVLILGGQAQFDKLSFTPREMEFSQVRDYVRSATMAAFGVVPVRLGIESQNYATAQSQMKLYWEGLAGRAALIDSEFTRLARMFGDDDVYVEHDFSNIAVLQESRTERVKRVLDWTLMGVPLSTAAAYEGFDDLPITQADDAQAAQDAQGPDEDETEVTDDFDFFHWRSLSDLSEAVQTGLRNRAKDHNEEVDEKGMAEWRKTTASTLASVFKRGVGAYQNNPGSVRPSVTSPEEWAYARVKSFIYVLKNDRFRSGKHDTDLLPAEHPLSSKEQSGKKKTFDLITGRKYEDIDFSVPSGVKDEMRRGLAWHEEGHSGDGLKPETVAWARRMVNGQDISPDKAVKMRAWLARHESDKSGEGFRPDEDGFPSPGRVAWALWGGDPAVSWSNKLVRQMENEDEEKTHVASVDEAVWRNFVEKVQEPAEKQIRDAIEVYFEQYAARIAQRLPDVLANYTKSILAGPVPDPDIVIKQGDEPWLDALLQLDIEGAAVDEAMRESFADAYKNSVRAATDAMPDRLAEEFSFPSQRIDNLVDEDLANFIGNIEAQTRTSVNVTIRNGLAEGMSVNQLQAALGTSFAFAPDRALRIARTEATRSVNAGGVLAWESAAGNVGLEVKFRWLSQSGARPEHAALHNTLRGDDGYWYAGGVKAPSPGNFEGSAKLAAAMNINCRCTFVPEIEDED